MADFRYRIRFPQASQPHPYSKVLNGLVGALLGAALVTAGLIGHLHPLPPLPNVLGLYVLAVAAIVLSSFHLRHTDLHGVSSETAGRISYVGAMAGLLGVQILTRTFDLRDAMGTGFLLMAPLLAQAMLTSALIGPSLAMFVLTVTCFMLGMAGTLPIGTLAVTWIGGAVASHAVNPIKHRNDLLRAIAIVSSANAIIACGATAMQVSTVLPVLSSAAWAALAGVVACSIFWMSVAVIEKMFNIVSDWTLLELCSPDHPLLRELVLRAPGTYAHSVMVGNLSEQAARSIGANPTLCRALAYFHDIGKITRPSHFIENQQGENVHDQLPATLSAKIILAHVQDGLEMAKTHKLPRIIQDGIMQHHGTSLMSYFYRKAQEESFDKPETVDEADFRYPGPKPQSKELAILHLADSVEAASRVIPRGESGSLEQAVKRIIEERRADGQLDECDLTFRELQMIQQSFMTTLSALRHERIAYPEETLYADTETENLDLHEFHPPREHAIGE